MPPYDIHARARELSAQRQMSLPDAYSELARRGLERRQHKAKYGSTPIDPNQQRSAFACVETPTAYRLPYADN
jgi:hypothetical protein